VKKKIVPPPRSPSDAYRRYLRTAVYVLGGTEEEMTALLLGKRLANATIQELEVLYVLYFKTNPLMHAPKGYRPKHEVVFCEPWEW
jgi:hypothetical protein